MNILTKLLRHMAIAKQRFMKYSWAYVSRHIASLLSIKTYAKQVYTIRHMTIAKQRFMKYSWAYVYI